MSVLVSVLDFPLIVRLARDPECGDQGFPREILADALEDNLFQHLAKRVRKQSVQLTTTGRIALKKAGRKKVSIQAQMMVRLMCRDWEGLRLMLDDTGVDLTVRRYVTATVLLVVRYWNSGVYADVVIPTKKQHPPWSIEEAITLLCCEE